MFTYVYALLVGMVFGSFFMVIAMRVPLGESIIVPRSHCYYCKYVLKPKELIPIISFCIQRGRCTNCKREISVLYVVFELVTGMIFFLTVYIIGVERELIIILSLVSLLLIISVTDYIYMLIPNRILAWFACLLILECIFVPLVTWPDSIVGGGVIFILLYCMQKIYPEGLGGGDVKLLSLLGFIVGLKGIFIVLFLASCFSLCFFGVGIVLKRVKMRTQIPFGPFISLGAICYMLITYAK
ncbi:MULTISPECIES: A24 family peptidase [Bacillus]|uniref:Prepilin peptidase n=2 Tax=Bacillus cereus group TaxID=86661 RepID=A0A2A7DD13_BACAN|nr:MULTISPECIES: A24 family peptidase [Bacillus]MCP1162668.1 prepilin peptidase [Bacillus sp. 1813sda1]MDC7973924.1 prepilin peptidase [Bacillus sp. BLCC-B18]OTW67931.1 prepilin peptidase [Bacillus thuringiensis serovar coreanensis]OTX44548.1 prepilin peptidase [Bacillus thuringiensis serovar sooncheon]OTX53712.1 prepilin peptidase [Bacillus thuringiensis serovar guiyangiensis]